MPKQEDWITTKEAMQLTGYTMDYVQDLAREGKIKARKVATVWLVDRKSLLAHIKAARAHGEKPGRKRTIDIQNQ